MSDAGQKSKSAKIKLAPSFHTYLTRAFYLGALEGPLGKQKFNPNVERLIRAMNHVLAGGEVEPPRIITRGNIHVVKELKQLLEQAIKEANEANRTLGPGKIPLST